MATKKKTTVKKPASKAEGFLGQVLKRINKDEKTVQKEVLSDRIEDFRIDAEAQISLLKNSEIPKAEASLKREKRELAKAKKALKDAYFSIDFYNSYESYVNNINNHKCGVEECESDICNTQSFIEELERQIEAHKEVLNKLNS